jgi:hypothetical protein
MRSTQRESEKKLANLQCTNSDLVLERDQLAESLKQSEEEKKSLRDALAHVTSTSQELEQALRASAHRQDNLAAKLKATLDHNSFLGDSNARLKALIRDRRAAHQPSANELESAFIESCNQDNEIPSMKVASPTASDHCELATLPQTLVDEEVLTSRDDMAARIVDLEIECDRLRRALEEQSHSMVMLDAKVHLQEAEKFQEVALALTGGETQPLTSEDNTHSIPAAASAQFTDSVVGLRKELGDQMKGDSVSDDRLLNMMKELTEAEGEKLRAEATMVRNTIKGKTDKLAELAASSETCETREVAAIASDLRCDMDRICNVVKQMAGELKAVSDENAEIRQAVTQLDTDVRQASVALERSPALNGDVDLHSCLAHVQCAKSTASLTQLKGVYGRLWQDHQRRKVPKRPHREPDRTQPFQRRFSELHRLPTTSGALRSPSADGTMELTDPASPPQPLKALAATVPMRVFSMEQVLPESGKKEAASLPIRGRRTSHSPHQRLSAPASRSQSVSDAISLPEVPAQRGVRPPSARRPEGKHRPSTGMQSCPLAAFRPS